MKKSYNITHYVSIIAVLVLIPLLLLGFMSIYNITKKGKELKAEHLASANRVSEQINYFMDLHVLAIDTLAKQIAQSDVLLLVLNDLITEVDCHYEGFSEIYMELSGVRASTEMYRVPYSKGMEITSLLFSNIGYDEFINRNEPYLSPVITDGKNKKMLLAVPIWKYGGTYCGFVVGVLDWNYVDNLLHQAKTYPSGYSVIFDSRGKVVDYLGTSAGVADKIVADIMPKLPFRTSISQEYFSPEYRRKEIAGYSFIQNPEWGMWSSAPIREVNLPLIGAAGLSLILLFLCAAVVVIVRRLLVLNIAQPISELYKACQKISYGDITFRVDLESYSLPVEIKMLGDRFNYMAASMYEINTLLRMHSEELEARIIERTKELVVKNRELSALYAVASSVSNTDNLKYVLKRVLREIDKLFRFDILSIVVYEEEGEKIEQSIWHNEYLADEKASFAARTERYRRWVIANSRPLIVNDLKDGQGDDEGLSKKEDSRSLICVPIINKNRILGTVMLAGNTANHFSDEQMIMLQAICNQLGVVITNVTLFNNINEEHDMFLAVMNSMNEGLALFDHKGQIIYVNQLLQKMFNLSSDGWQGTSFKEILKVLNNMDTDIPFMDLHSDFLHQRVFLQREGSLRIDDKAYYYSITGFPVLSDGAFIGYGYIFRDITKEKGVEILKNSILSTVSHELCTPLTSIRGNAESLLRKDIDLHEKEKEKFIRVIVEESKRLTDLIKNVMDMSKIEAGVLYLDKEVLDIRRVIQGFVERYKQRRTDVEFYVEQEREVPLVDIDKVRIEQVLSNLIENGIKYSPEKAEIRIETKYLLDKKTVMVSVIDKGIGIEPEHYEAIFGRFYRVDSATVNKISGSGVGLSIAKGIINAHGGKLWVESVVGKGSCFNFTIPVKNGGGS